MAKMRQPIAAIRYGSCGCELRPEFPARILDVAKRIGRGS
jgi:hypothetical protein